MRLNPYATRPNAYQAVRAVFREIHAGSLEPSVRALVEIRVSQLNGCGFCLAMHTDQARAAGVPQSKLDTVAGWRDDGQFTTRERTAVELAEALTGDLTNGVPAELWSRAETAFDDAEVTDLLYLIGVMNLFNRLNVATEFSADVWRDHGIRGIAAATPD